MIVSYVPTRYLPQQWRFGADTTEVPGNNKINNNNISLLHQQQVAHLEMYPWLSTSRPCRKSPSQKQRRHRPPIDSNGKGVAAAVAAAITSAESGEVKRGRHGRTGGGGGQAEENGGERSRKSERRERERDAQMASSLKALEHTFEIQISSGSSRFYCSA